MVTELILELVSVIISLLLVIGLVCLGKFSISFKKRAINKINTTPTGTNNI